MAQCSRNAYDIVFLDHMMPGVDGVETLKRIRELRGGIYQDLPVIALTANTVSGAREMFRSEGFTEFVPKPIERTVLERVLRKVLPKDSIQYSTQTNENAGAALPEPTEQLNQPEQPQVLEAPEAPKVLEAPEVPEGKPSLPYEELTKAGVNVDLGLDYCGGEEDFFREMLRIFYAQGADKRAELAALYESANWPDYAIKVHALKSTSLTIGAEKLSAYAKELELAGKKKDTAYIREHHPILLRQYEELCEHFAGI